MKKSEIFDSFVKIAQEKGMISNDSSESRKKLEQNPRADSLDASAIEALYGTKPNTPKSMAYEKNIMEVAHPNSVVVSPSHDKLNGLVENEIERQNINLHIVNKTPDGLSTKHKYAEKELVLSLVRVGNVLDNANQDNLRSLTDFCLLQTTAKMNKTANPAAAVIVPVAALLGLIYLKNHMRFISDGFEQDHKKLIAEIDDLVNSNSDWGVGYKYKPDFLNMMKSFKEKLNGYYTMYAKIAPIIDELQKPRDAKELMAMAKKPETVNLIENYSAFRDATNQLLPMILKIEEDFGSEFYKQRQVEDKGWMTSLVDAPQVFHGGKGLVADDFDDVKHALETYVLDIQNIIKTLSSTDTLRQKITDDLQQASYKSSELFGTPKVEKPTQTVEDLDGEAAKLSNMLGGMGITP